METLSSFTIIRDSKDYYTCLSTQFYFYNLFGVHFADNQSVSEYFTIMTWIPKSNSRSEWKRDNGGSGNDDLKLE